MSAASPAVGDELPPLRRLLDLPALVAYAGATWDWYRLHYDSEFVAASRLPAPLVDGQMLGALLAEHVLDWLGPNARLERLHFRFKAPVFARETIRCEATVAEVSEVDGGLRIELEERVLVEAAPGASERLAVAPAGATALLSW